MPDPIYLDYNATTPVDARVAAAIEPWLREHFGNPSSGHVFGRRAREAVERAREQVAALIGARPDEIVFTASGSESNNMVIQGCARGARPDRVHLVCSAIEHPAVLEPCLAMEEEGHRLSVVKVDGRGRVAPEAVEAALTEDTRLVSVMHANNEVGTIQPIAAIARLAHARGALCHTDAAQSLGKIPVDVGALEVDLLTIAGHKLYAPKGIGALYIRRGVELARLIHGAGHEAGRRAGTESVPLIVGLGEACRLAAGHLDAGEARRLETLRERLWQGLRPAGDLLRHGAAEQSLPNTLSVGFRGIEADRLLEAIAPAVAASAGAACHAAGVSVSWVLHAMGVDAEWARGTLRLTVGRPTTEDEVDRAAEAIVAAVRRLRGSRF
ncbi:MAG: cysteine desulfurase family protein [Acidobacteriota bacterium]|nr:cysteine desulfurase family protein [Acidobacteriota bacterium]